MANRTGSMRGVATVLVSVASWLSGCSGGRNGPGPDADAGDGSGDIAGFDVTPDLLT